jgi:hypothetical protein
VFASAKAYKAARAAAASGTGPYHPSDSRWEAMLPVLDGGVPVVVDANDIRQIQDAIKWSEDEGVKLVLRGARDAGYIAEHIASKQIPVVLTEVIAGPERSATGSPTTRRIHCRRACTARESGSRSRAARARPTRTACLTRRARPWPSGCRRRRRSRP